MCVLCAMLATFTPAPMLIWIPTGDIFYTKRNRYFALRASTTSASTMSTAFTRMVTSTTTAVWIGIPAGGFAYSPWSDRNDLSCNVNGNGYTSADYFGVMWNSGEIKTSPHTDSGNNLARDIC